MRFDPVPSKRDGGTMKISLLPERCQGVDSMWKSRDGDLGSVPLLAKFQHADADVDADAA
jgi:hypothetical protein